jgi:sulfate permease, SulP family
MASVILVIVGFMESLTLGKIMADRNNYRINVKREVIALSASNIVGSMFSCYYTGGAFSRTALNDVLGPKSNIHGLVQGACFF